MALDSDETAQKRLDLAEEGAQLPPEQAVGMSLEDILSYFYQKIAFTLGKEGWQTAFDAEPCAA